MATVNFLYRSSRQEAFLSMRLLHRYEGIDYVYGVKTGLKVSKHYWEKEHDQKRSKDAQTLNKQTEVRNELNKLRQFVLNRFDRTPKHRVNKEWLQSLVNEFFDPNSINEISDEIILYADTFISYKVNEVTQSSIKKYRVVQNLLRRYQEEIGRPVFIKDIGLEFKRDFENYCLDNNYAPNTIARAIRTIKSICNHAYRYHRIEINEGLEFIKVKYERVSHIYLTEQDLEKLHKLDDDIIPEHLINAKDWLLISCYTGQRISDFMRFNEQMIRFEKNKKGVEKPFLEFTQTKTSRRMIIPLQSKVMSILDKRNGAFPRKILDQNYNEHIKKVCDIAGITELVNGSKKVLVSFEKNEYRKQDGQYPKWELVASHIGRRTFATLNYGKIPTAYLMQITGHNTEKMLLEYIGKSNKDFAMDIMEYFD